MNPKNAGRPPNDIQQIDLAFETIMKNMPRCSKCDRIISTKLSKEYKAKKKAPLCHTCYVESKQ